MNIRRFYMIALRDGAHPVDLLQVKRFRQEKEVITIEYWHAIRGTEHLNLGSEELARKEYQGLWNRFYFTHVEIGDYKHLPGDLREPAPKLSGKTEKVKK